MLYSQLLLGYKPVQHVTVLNTVGSCNTMVLYYIILQYYGTTVVLRSVVEGNVFMRRITVFDNVV
jgi:hypothetical protein